MKSFALIGTVLGASVISLAYAGGPVHPKKIAAPVDPLMAMVAQGNSVWPSNTYKLLNGKLLIGALANLDGYWSSASNYTLVPQFNRNLGAGSNSSAIYLNNANVFVGGDMGIAHARLNLGYFDRRTILTPAGPAFGGQNNFTLDEGYLSLYDSTKMPLYMKAGKFYDNVGMYNPYELVPDLTNLFTEMGVTGIEVGAVLPKGFYGSITGFSGASTAVSPANQSRVDNLSAKVGYAGNAQGVHWGADLGYIANMNDLAYLNSNDFTSNLSGGSASFSKKSSVLAADFYADMDHFDFLGKYSQLNEDKMTVSDPTATYDVNQPWAFVLGAGYGFDTANHPSRIGVGYQMTRHADYLFMPKTRYLVDYNVGITKNIGFQLAYYYDQNYTYTGTYQTTMVGHSNLFAARLSAHF